MEPPHHPPSLPYIFQSWIKRRRKKKKRGGSRKKKKKK